MSTSPLKTKLKKTESPEGERFVLTRSKVNSFGELLLSIGMGYALVFGLMTFLQDEEAGWFWIVFFVFLFAMGFLVFFIKALYGFYAKEIFVLTEDSLLYQQLFFGKGETKEFPYEDINELSTLRRSKVKYHKINAS